MKLIVSVLLLMFTSCFLKTTNKMAICIENNSDVDSVVNIKTLVNGKFYKLVPVKRNFTIVHFERFFIEFPAKTNNVELTFVVDRSKDTAKCIIHKDSLTAKSCIHVNFNETVFRKGNQIYDQILQKDSLIQKAFYCEIVNGQILP